MSLYVSKRSIYQYLLIYICIALNGAFWFELYYNQAILVVTTLFVLHIVRRRKWNDSTFIWSGLMLFSIVAVRMLSGGIGVDAWLLLTAQIGISYLVVSADPDNFCTRYVNIVVILAVFSLVGYALSYISPSVLTDLLQANTAGSYNNSTFYGLFLYVFRPIKAETALFRNVGIFTEPGRYQIILNCAIFIVLFFREKLNLSKKRISKYLIILIAALITTMSTTGYIGLFILFIGYVLNRNVHSKETRDVRVMLIIIIVTVILATDYWRNGENSLINTYLFSKLSDTQANVDNSSGGARILMFTSMLDVILRNPLGTGFTNARVVLATNAAGCGFMTLIAAMGVIPVVGSFVWMFIRIARNIGSVVPFFTLLALYINTIFAQTYTFFPAFCIFMYCVLCKESNETARIEVRLEGDSL